MLLRNNLNLDHAVECTHCKLMDGVNLGGLGEVAGSPEGHAVIQRDLDKMERWAGKNLLQFSKSCTGVEQFLAQKMCWGPPRWKAAGRKGLGGQ